MGTLTITNLTATQIYLSDFSVPLEGGKTVSIEATINDLQEITDIHSKKAAGTISLSFTYGADELASGIVPLPGSFKGAISQSSLELTTATTLWIDVVNGSDSNTGTQTSPLKTITAAVASLPPTLSANVTLNLKPGTYREEPTLDFKFTKNARFTLQGTDWMTTTPATGPSTGTIASSTGSPLVLSVTGATWTVNDLKKSFVFLTSGSKSGEAFPICSNTSNTIEIAGCENQSAWFNSSTFKIGKPAATLIGVQARAWTLLIQGANPTAITAGLTSSGGTTQSPRYLLSSLEFLPNNPLATASASSRYGLYVYLAGVQLSQCAFTDDGVTTFGGIYVLEPTDLLVDKCYLSTKSSGGSPALNMSFGIKSSKAMSISGSLFDSGGVGFRGYSTSPTSSTVYFNNDTYGSCVFQNQANAAIVAGAISVGTNGPVYIRTGVVGIVGLGASVYGTVIISDMSSHGIHLQYADGTVLPGMAYLSSISITSCGGDAIRLESLHTQLHITGSANIANNTGYGVNTAPVVQSQGNMVFIDSAVTMSSNTAGDFLLSGATVNSLTDLRSAPSKTLTDTARFTRIIGG